MWSGELVRRAWSGFDSLCQSFRALVKGATLWFLRRISFWLTRCFGIGLSLHSRAEAEQIHPDLDYLQYLGEAHSIHEKQGISKSSDSNNLKLGPKIISEQLKHGLHLGEKDWDRIGVWAVIDTTNLGDLIPSGRLEVLFPLGKAHDQRIPNWKSSEYPAASRDLRVRWICRKLGFKRLDYARIWFAFIGPTWANQQGRFPIPFLRFRWKVSQKVALSPKAFSELLSIGTRSSFGSLADQ